MEREPLWVDKEWDQIRDAFRKAVDKDLSLAYFTIARVVDAGNGAYESSQRCDFTAECLNRFLDVEQSLAAATDSMALIEPAIQWLRNRAENCSIGRNNAVFRIQLFTPRGERKLDTLRCTIAYEELPAAPKVERPEVDASIGRISRAMEELSAAYLTFNNWQTSCTQRLMNVFWDVQGFYERVIRSASGENITLRTEIQKFMDSHHQKMSELHGQLLNIKVEVARVQMTGEAAQITGYRETELEKARLAMGEKLGGNFIDGLAEMGKTYLAAKMQVDPRLMNFLKLASNDEELINLLTHPEVSRTFEKPGSGAAVVDILKEFLRTPELLAALSNPALPRALKRPQIRALLLSSLQSLISGVEAEDQAAAKAEKAEKAEKTEKAEPVVEPPKENP